MHLVREVIRKGKTYQSEAIIYDGDFQHHKYHPECFLAAKAMAKIEGQFDFVPGDFIRGTMNTE